MGSRRARLIGLGLGPGDPELVTLKAARTMAGADLLLYPGSRTGKGKTPASRAGAIVSRFAGPQSHCSCLIFPKTGANVQASAGYRDEVNAFYDKASERIATNVQRGQQVVFAVLGDPFVHGTFVHLFARLEGLIPIEIIPGVSAATAGAAALRVPLCFQEDRFAILPATLDDAKLAAAMDALESFVLFKLGGKIGRLKRLLREKGLGERALYIERASMSDQVIVPLDQVGDGADPYFSMIFVPTRRNARPGS